MTCLMTGLQSTHQCSESEPWLTRVLCIPFLFWFFHNGDKLVKSFISLEYKRRRYSVVASSNLHTVHRALACLSCSIIGTRDLSCQFHALYVLLLFSVIRWCISHYTVPAQTVRAEYGWKTSASHCMSTEDTHGLLPDCVSTRVSVSICLYVCSYVRLFHCDVVFHVQLPVSNLGAFLKERSTV